MEIKRKSHFKDIRRDLAWFDDWVNDLEIANGKQYERMEVKTPLGITHVWGLNTEDQNAETLVVFPGARTTALFWDFDNNLAHLGKNLRLFLVETNGLPNLSDGHTPDIRSLDYGEWANEVIEKLNIDKAFVAGASFGGLICMKLAITNPEKIKSVFLLNPGCLQSFSLSAKNLYYNLLPLIVPTHANIKKFLDKAIFCKPNHQLSEAAQKLLIDYEHFAMTRYADQTQKPYDMDNELRGVNVPTYLLLGDRDLLFPFERSIRQAQDKISTLKEIKVFANVGHGIETYAKAMEYIGSQIPNSR
ncbi:alpha/beta fold hydrolase [Flavobacterium sp.]|uniref:alpha/beta fold hydrolase n=1 Tax=Flavobacterium sp. TaxID=239 RepID=UPI0039E3FD09